MRDYGTNGFRRQVEDYYEDEEEYDDDDGYQEEASDAEEEEMEPPKLTKEEQEFFSIREKLKEDARRRAKGQLASAFGRLSSSQDSRRTLPARDRFGSFFGPSQSVIASRVIEESRSIRDTQNIMSKVPRSSGKSDPQSSKIKPNENHQPRKVVSEVKRKAQTLKDSRDYSFLLSDDGDLPAPAPKEQPASRTSLAPKSDGRFAPAPRMSKASTSQPARLSANGHGVKNSSIVQRSVQNKVGTMMEASANKERQLSIDQKRMPNGVKTPSQKPANTAVVANKAPAKVVNDPSSLRKHSLNDPSLRRKHSMNDPSVRKNSRDDLSVRKNARDDLSVRKNTRDDPSVRKNPATLKPHSSQSHYSEQKRSVQLPDKAKVAPKQLGPSSRPQPSRPISSHGARDDRSKKRPARKRAFDDEDDPEDALRMLRQMTGYDPRKFRDSDDTSDMEANFDTIMREERRSSKIAREEDERELKLIQEEERRERMRKKQRNR